MKRIFSIFAAALSVLALAGCGYHIGARSMMHPQIKTIAVAEVKNDTIEPLAADRLRMQLNAEYQRDGALILKGMKEADCICYAKILNVSNRTIREDSYDSEVTYRPAEFRLTVTAEFVVVIPGKAEPLIATRQVKGYADYQILNDMAVNRENALKQACFNAARKIVTYTTEAW